MNACAVEDCHQAATQIIDLTRLPGKEREGYPSLQWVVCDFHHRALSEGEPFSFGEDMSKIRLGAGQVPPRLITFRVKDAGMADSEVTLSVGHDGVVSSEWTFQTSRDVGWALINASLEKDSPLRAELDRNKPSAE